MKATANNGDKWTGEVITKGFDKFYLYEDKDGFTYESKEVPAYRIDLTNCTQVEIDGNLAIIPLSKLQESNLSTRN